MTQSGFGTIVVSVSKNTHTTNTHMSYPDYPIEIHLHDKDGFVSFVESYKDEYDAVKAMPTMIAECRAEGEEYAGQHLLIVRHEVDGYTEWHEPIEKFEIFS